MVASPPQGLLSVAQLNTLGMAQSIPVFGSADTANASKGSLTFVGQDAQIVSLGAFFPCIKTAAVMPPNVITRFMRVAANVRLPDGTIPCFIFFAEPVKADFNDFLGFQWDGVGTLSMKTRRGGTETLTTLAETVAFMQSYHEYRIEYQRTQVKFILDNNLVATHTTNISAPPHVWEAGEINNVAGTSLVKFPFIYLYPDDPGGTLAGSGIPQIVGFHSSVGNTGAVVNAINYTPPTQAMRYRIQATVNVTAWTTPASFTVPITYKDGSGNARTDTLAMDKDTGTLQTAGAINAVDRFYGYGTIIEVDNSGTAITLSTSGTFTGSPVYNLSAILEEIG